MPTSKRRLKLLKRPSAPYNIYKTERRYIVINQPDKKEKTKAIQFRIDETLLKRFNEVTERYSVNKSALIRSWIEQYLEKHKDE
ncbi:ribbon-helix-helix domain-containing protein [Megasphaera massiliensis]|uniref:ribbon-helix-helix domain-containing protein n=1 Tax=Megasphaera massiliensis TaxID=1232428 RepID=UPI003B9682BB